MKDWKKKSRRRDTGRMRIMMEIMLGMTQEEGLNCLLCLLPRCVCHITIELTKLDLKLKVLRNNDKEEEDQGAVDVVDDGKETDEPGKKDEGRLKQAEEIMMMSKMMKKAEMMEEAAKTRKKTIQKRKEEQRKEQDEKQAKQNKNMLEMLKHWQGVEKAYKPPNINDKVRKRGAEEAAKKSKQQEEEEQQCVNSNVRKQEIQEGRRIEASPGSGIPKFEIKYTVRKQEEGQENRKEAWKEVTSR